MKKSIRKTIASAICSAAVLGTLGAGLVGMTDAAEARPMRDVGFDPPPVVPENKR